MIEPKAEFMRAAMEEALIVKEQGDYAIGAVIVLDEKIIARGVNRVKIDADSTQHAEMVVIREASKLLQSRYLENCVLYTTHEPCPMCAAAAVWAKLAGVVFGARMEDMINYQTKSKNSEWTWRTIHIPARKVFAKGEPKVELIEGFMRAECADLFHS